MATALRWQPLSCCHRRAWKPVVLPMDGNGNFRLCSHALGKVSIDEFSLYFVLVFIVDEEYKKLANS